MNNRDWLCALFTTLKKGSDPSSIGEEILSALMDALSDDLTKTKPTLSPFVDLAMWVIHVHDTSVGCLNEQDIESIRKLVEDVFPELYQSTSK